VKCFSGTVSHHRKSNRCKGSACGEWQSQHHKTASESCVWTAAVNCARQCSGKWLHCWNFSD